MLQNERAREIVFRYSQGTTNVFFNAYVISIKFIVVAPDFKESVVFSTLYKISIKKLIRFSELNRQTNP